MEVSTVNQSALDLILERLDKIDKKIGESASKKIKKNSISSSNRSITTYDNICIDKFDDNDSFVNIALITKGEDIAPVIEVPMDDFRTISDNSKKEHTKHLKFYSYKFSDKQAMFEEGEWIFG